MEKKKVSSRNVVGIADNHIVKNNLKWIIFTIIIKNKASIKKTKEGILQS